MSSSLLQPANDYDDAPPAYSEYDDAAVPLYTATPSPAPPLTSASTSTSTPTNIRRTTSKEASQPFHPSLLTIHHDLIIAIPTNKACPPRALYQLSAPVTTPLHSLRIRRLTRQTDQQLALFYVDNNSNNNTSNSHSAPSLLSSSSPSPPHTPAFIKSLTMYQLWRPTFDPSSVDLIADHHPHAPGGGGGGGGGDTQAANWRLSRIKGHECQVTREIAAPAPLPPLIAPVWNVKRVRGGSGGGGGSIGGGGKHSRGVRSRLSASFGKKIETSSTLSSSSSSSSVAAAADEEEIRLEWRAAATASRTRARQRVVALETIGRDLSLSLVDYGGDDDGEDEDEEEGLSADELDSLVACWVAKVWHQRAAPSRYMPAKTPFGYATMPGKSSTTTTMRRSMAAGFLG